MREKERERDRLKKWSSKERGEAGEESRELDNQKLTATAGDREKKEEQ